MQNVNNVHSISHSSDADDIFDNINNTQPPDPDPPTAASATSMTSSPLLNPRPVPLPSSVPRIRVSNRPRTPILFHRTLRDVNILSASSAIKWRIRCFRQEDDSAESFRQELCGDIPHGDVVEPGIGVKQETSRKDWLSKSREAAGSLRAAVGKRWTVPWSAQTILQVMVLWISSFLFIGSWVIPFLAHVSGFSKESLTYRGQAFYCLLTDLTEGLAGVAILHRCLSRFYPLPKGWFRFSLKGNWQIDVILSCFLFPLVNRLSQLNLDLFPLMPSTPITISSVEQSILARDPVTMALYALVVSVCSPVWEEIVFRGFLLPSLTRYMPVWGAILLSSVAFSLAHFNVQRMLPLIFLGVVMGLVFTRSRNLLPSMLLHSLWNGFVFLDLMKLS